MDDQIEAVTVVKVADSAKQQRDEKASVVARHFTMETLIEEQESTPNKKPRNTTEMKEIILELKVKELQDRKEARDEQAKERKADRVHTISMVQEVTESILEFMAANRKK
ncbi:hypothetical protein BBJ28_00008258 [Nothophytophthora sp. Chile5]|nr:hypothetical protein BBJ28_00008258 [Nothophytophthora sp. Chile5]